MNTLPLEIEDRIWYLYYADIYKHVINEINNKRNFVIKLNKLTNLIVNNILLNNYFDIDRSELIDLNNELLKNIQDKSFYLLYKHDVYFNYIYQILKFQKIYPDIPESCKLIGAYLNKKSNFNKKFYKRLKVITSGENTLFSKMIV